MDRAGAALLTPLVRDQIWLHAYPVRYFGTRFDARMTVVRLADGRLWLHSPCAFDAALRDAVATLGEVGFIVAPGTFHHLHVPSAQAAFPEARTYVCPGVETMQPGLRFDARLDDAPPAGWAADLDQARVRGARWIGEVAFLHRASHTLILVDVLENFTDATPNVDWRLRLWMQVVFRMWNRPRPAPEYRLGWTDRAAALASLETILRWDFTRVVMAHGDVIETDARAAVEAAWRTVVESG